MVFYGSFRTTTKQKPTGESKTLREGNQRIPLQKIIDPQKKAAREEERNKLTTKRKTTLTMALVSPYLSVTLNINGLNSPMKRHKVTGWIKNQSQLY